MVLWSCRIQYCYWTQLELAFVCHRKILHQIQMFEHKTWLFKPLLFRLNSLLIRSDLIPSHPFNAHQLHVETRGNCRDSTEAVKAYSTKHCPWLWLSMGHFFLYYSLAREKDSAQCSFPRTGYISLGILLCWSPFCILHGELENHFYHLLVLEQEKNIFFKFFFTHCFTHTPRCAWVEKFQASCTLSHPHCMASVEQSPLCQTGLGVTMWGTSHREEMLCSFCLSFPSE